jgi:hypothetical protein
VIGADELKNGIRSVSIDSTTQNAGMQLGFNWDKDGNIVYDGAANKITGGYKYPEMQFTVSKIRYLDVYDNITVKTRINDTYTKIENYIIYRYEMVAYITAVPDSFIIKNVISAYEGKFASESPYQPTAPLSFTVKIGLDIQPWVNTPVQQYGITWMQLNKIEVDERTPSQATYPSSSDVVWYSADRNIMNVGATFGSNYKANELIGRELPTSGDLTITGSYRAGSVCLYDPNNIIPGDLYQVVPIAPVIKATIIVHIAGYNFYVEGENIPEPVASPPPPPLIPKLVIPDYILIAMVLVALIPILIFGLPRLVYALRRRV